MHRELQALIGVLALCLKLKPPTRREGIVAMHPAKPIVRLNAMLDIHPLS